MQETLIGAEGDAEVLRRAEWAIPKRGSAVADRAVLAFARGLQRAPGSRFGVAHSAVGRAKGVGSAGLIRRSCFGIAQRLAIQLQAIGVVNQPVQQGIGDRGIADDLVPLGHGVLAGQERGPSADAIIDYLQQVAVGLGLGRGQAEVIDDKQIQPGQGLEQGDQAAVGVGGFQAAKQLGRVEVLSAQAVAAGLVAQGAR